LARRIVWDEFRKQLCVASVLAAAAIRVAQAMPLAEDAEPEYEYPSRMAKKKDSKKMGSGPRTRRKKEKKGK
jgi:hypothetical protein